MSEADRQRSCALQIADSDEKIMHSEIGVIKNGADRNKLGIVLIDVFEHHCASNELE